jgi:hypothetical protein
MSDNNIDCIVSSWEYNYLDNKTGELVEFKCNKNTNTIKRVRKIIQSNSGNGKKCPHLEETIPCNLCTEPPSINNLSEDTISKCTDLKNNEFCDIKCKEGYNKFGDYDIKCNNGIYDNVDKVKCKPFCKLPDNVNTINKCTNYENDICPKNKITCNYGYQKVGDGNITCQMNGEWTDNVKCIKKCEIPNSIKKLDCQNIESSRCNYDDITCMDGYFKLGLKSESNLCIDGKWTNDIKCVKKCRIPDNVKSIGNCNNIDKSQCQDYDVLCEPGYEKIGSGNITCLNGKWSNEIKCIKQCKLPNNVKSINCNKYEGQFCNKDNIICKDGYVLNGNGNGSLKCENGVWVGDLKCISKCSLPNGVNKLNNCNHLENSICTNENIICLDDHTKIGSGNLQCINGIWEGDTECVKDCKALPEQNFKSIGNCKNKNECLLSEIKCNDNYIPVGGDSIKCINGKWNNDIRCKKKCNILENAELMKKCNNYEGSICDKKNITCKKNYKLIGRERTNCFNGKWSDSLKCVRKCPNINNSLVMDCNDTDASLCLRDKIKCQKGYELIGTTDNLICNNGLWNGNLKCVKKCDLPNNVDLLKNCNNNNGDSCHKDNIICKKGYTLHSDNDNEYIKCINSEWTDNLKCIKKCKEPDNMILNCDNYDGSICKSNKIKCTNDTFKVGSDNLTCKNGIWKGNIKCNDKCDLPNGVKSMNNCTNTFNSTCKYENINCKDNHYKLGSGTITCDKGKWSNNIKCVSKCQNPTGMLINQFCNNESGSKCNHKNVICNEGYKLVGKGNITCNDGKWSNEFKCEKICDLDNTNIETINNCLNTTDSECSDENITCKPGFEKMYSSKNKKIKCTNYENHELIKSINIFKKNLINILSDLEYKYNSINSNDEFPLFLLYNIKDNVKTNLNIDFNKKDIENIYQEILKVKLFNIIINKQSICDIIINYLLKEYAISSKWNNNIICSDKKCKLPDNVLKLNNTCFNKHNTMCKTNDFVCKNGFINNIGKTKCIDGLWQGDDICVPQCNLPTNFYNVTNNCKTMDKNCYNQDIKCKDKFIKKKKYKENTGIMKCPLVNGKPNCLNYNQNFNCSKSNINECIWDSLDIAKKNCDIWDDCYGFYIDINGKYHARGKDFTPCFNEDCNEWNDDYKYYKSYYIGRFSDIQGKVFACTPEQNTISEIDCIPNNIENFSTKIPDYLYSINGDFLII